MHVISADIATDRSILSITGTDASHFLQGLITNDVVKADNGLVYAALLSPQGKYLADFLLLKQDHGYLLDVDTELAPGLAQRLGMYKLRADVQIEQTDIKVLRGVGGAPDGALADPRQEGLGWRIYADELPEHSPAGTDWTAFQIALGVPQSGVEMIPNESYILECGFEQLNGVDFRKGCFVGQEVTARMHHKTTLKKGLRKVVVAGDAAPGTEITANGKAVGTLHSVRGELGLAYLRFDRATGEMTAGEASVTLAD